LFLYRNLIKFGRKSGDKMRKSRLLEYGLVLLGVVLLMSPLIVSAQGTRVNLNTPAGAVTVYIRNQAGAETDKFFVDVPDTLFVYAGSSQPIRVTLEFILSYPDPSISPLDMGSFTIDAQPGGVVLARQFGRADPKGRYALRIIAKNPTTGAEWDREDIMFMATDWWGEYGLWLVAGIVVIGVVVAAVVYYLRRPPTPPPGEGTGTEVREPGTEIGQPGTVQYLGASLVVGSEKLPLTQPYTVLGRTELSKFVGQEARNLISRKHVAIYLKAGGFQVQDADSTNGTLLNGQEIRGKGPQPLKNGDIISPAGAVNITFEQAPA